MTNLPFGFSPSGDDDPEEPRPGQGPGQGGFDLSQLGSMLSQLGQMMSQAGASGSQTGPVNYDLARQLATSQIPASHPASSVDVTKATEAVALAEIWLDGATSLPAGAKTTTAWTPRQWVDATMPAWEKLCSPIAEQVSKAWVDGLPDQAKEQAGPLLAMMGSMGGMAFGSQLGQGLAQLATEVLTSTDVGLPLGPDGTAALMPRSIAEFGAGLNLPEDQVRLYLAAREAAHHRLYAGVPWLRNRVLSLINDYAQAISVDFSAVEKLASSIDPNDPASIEAVLGQGMFEPTITPGQQHAMAQLEKLLALVEGWVDTVVAAAVGDRLPGASALRETLRRRRATGGPAEQTFATLIGLELRPRRLRAAAELWEAVGESRGMEGRDALWAHPDLLPSLSDLDDPKAFVDRDKQFAELLVGFDEVDTSVLDEGQDAEPDTSESDASEPDTTESDTDRAGHGRAGHRRAGQRRGGSGRVRRRDGPRPGPGAAAPAAGLSRRAASGHTELDGLHRLIPESTACRPIVASSSSANPRFRTAARLSSNWRTDEAPTSADDTRSSRSTQDSASCARVCPRSLAMSFNARTWPSAFSVSRSVLSEPPRDARDPSGTPWR